MKPLTFRQFVLIMLFGPPVAFLLVFFLTDRIADFLHTPWFFVAFGLEALVVLGFIVFTIMEEFKGTQGR